MTAVIRMHLIVHGKVQGVFFRKHTHKTAVALGLRGVVRNLANGTVEVESEAAAAERKRLTALEDWCRTKGSPRSNVSSVVSAYTEQESFSFAEKFFIDKTSEKTK
eukprot:Rhum_TRINITY_DN12297_c0_g1::Rhum_TRINITY_DN12297_c0_g1_i1::g.50753::m.50753/K01512/acyP; acylphosphatase